MRGLLLRDASAVLRYSRPQYIGHRPTFAVAAIVYQASEEALILARRLSTRLRKERYNSLIYYECGGRTSIMFHGHRLERPTKVLRTQDLWEFEEVFRPDILLAACSKRSLIRVPG